MVGDDTPPGGPARFRHAWHDMLAAADEAGRRAARELATRCSPHELNHTGTLSIHVEPVDAPLVTWLYRHGYGHVTEDGTGVLLPVQLSAADLGPVAESGHRARSLKLRRAYAAAYCTVLTEEAGVTATIRVQSSSLDLSCPPPPDALGTAGTETGQATGA